MSTTILRPVRPESPAGPPTTNRPVGFTWNFVAAGWADRCEIQVSYAIGVAAPTSYRVQFFGTAKGGATEDKAVAVLKSGEIFDFRPGRLIAELGLLSPKGWSYRETASGGHFGRAEFPWERTDKVEAVRDALGLR